MRLSACEEDTIGMNIGVGRGQISPERLETV